MAEVELSVTFDEDPNCTDGYTEGNWELLKVTRKNCAARLIRCTCRYSPLPFHATGHPDGGALVAGSKFQSQIASNAAALEALPLDTGRARLLFWLLIIRIRAFATE